MPDLTLMAVHAHPDDECISTGGILARYAAEGVRTVLVTCTDGSCGDADGGLKPSDPGHDREAVVAARTAELRASADILGVSDLELLGYRDSGMMGWPQNDQPGSFWTTPVHDAATRLAGLVRHYRPQVVVTYDENGFYGHPDHIQAHRVTTAAAALTGIPRKLYHTAVPRSAMAELGARMRELGVLDEPADEEGPRQEWGTPDERITTVVDVSGFTSAKYSAIGCHASQSDNIFFLRMGPDAFAEIMGRETFVRVEDRSGAPLPESDLFAGLR